MCSISGSRAGSPQYYNGQNVLMSVSEFKNRLDAGTAQKNDSSIIATIWNMIKEFFNGTDKDKVCGTFCDIFNFDNKNDERRAQEVLVFMSSLKADSRQQLVWEATDGINGNPPTFSVSMNLSGRTFGSPEMKFDALAKAYNKLAYDRGYFYDTRKEWAESLYGDINNAEVYEKLAEFFSDNAHDKENLVSLLDLIKNITKKVSLTEGDESLFNKIINHHVKNVFLSKTDSTGNDYTWINHLNLTKHLEDFFGVPLSCTKPITNPEKINHSLAKFFLDIIVNSENPELALKYMERFLNKELLPEHVYEKLISTYEYIATEICKDTYENRLPYYMFGYNNYNRGIVKEIIFTQLLIRGEIEMLKNLDAQLSGLQYKEDAHLFLEKLPETYQELSKKHELSYYEQRLLNFLKENQKYRKIEASNLLTTFANGVVTGAGAVFNAFIDSED